MRLLCNKCGRKAIPPSKIEGAGGADVPKALIYLVYAESFVFPLDNEMKNRYKS